MMKGLKISGRFLIKRFQNEHVFSGAFLLAIPILIEVKSFYLRYAESSLEVHSLTT